MTRVLVVDDEAVIRDGLALIIDIDPSVELTGTAADGQAAAACCDTDPPDVVLMDLRMPGWDGVRATTHIMARHPEVRIIALTTFSVENLVWDALRAGASGYLLKDTPRDRLIAAIHAVAAGETPLSPSLTALLAERFAGAPRPSPDGIPAELTVLSEREVEVLHRVAAGDSNAEIASRLHIGHATVKTHLANLMAKLDVRDRVHLVITAYETGLISPGSSNYRNR